MTAEQERDALAEAIISAGVKAGIVNNDAPLTGPHLIMICDDLAGIAGAAELRGAERMRERCARHARQLAAIHRSYAGHHEDEREFELLMTRGEELDTFATALAALPLEEGE